MSKGPASSTRFLHATLVDMFIRVGKEKNKDDLISYVSSSIDRLAAGFLYCKRRSCLRNRTYSTTSYHLSKLNNRYSFRIVVLPGDGIGTRS